MWWTSFLSIGYVPAVFVAGRWLAINTFREKLPNINRAGQFALFSSLGVLAWLPILFLLAAFGIFRPELIGAAGWLIGLVSVIRTRPSLTLNKSEWLALLGAFSLFVFYAAFSAESVQGGRDQGAYSLHAASIAHTGDLRSPLPSDYFQSDNKEYRHLLSSSNPIGFNYDIDQGYMEAQFPPSASLNMAQFAGIGGYKGVTLFNPYIAAISALLFFALTRQFATKNWSLLATLVFALNPAQLWNARITLSEPLAQSLILSGLLLASVCLNSRRSKLYIVSILVLSSSTFVRIDCFLLATLIPFAHLVRVLICDKSKLQETASLVHKSNAALAGLIGLSWLFYEYNTPRYFDDFTNKLLLFLAVGALLAALSGVVQLLRSKGFDTLERTFLNKPTWISIVSIIVAATFYGIFIRPYLEPFAQFEDAHYGTRNFQENTLLDLAAYISYPVIALAVFALATRLREIIINRKVAIVLALTIWAGFSLAYLQDPRISPDHIWRIRRFTPIIIPGFILFAAIGVSSLKLRLVSNRLFQSAAWVCAFAFICYASFPIASLKHYEGTFEILDEINDAIPSNAIIVTDVTSRVYSGLYLAYGREIVRGDLKRPKHKQLLEMIAADSTAKGRPAYLLTHKKVVNYLGDQDAFHWLYRYPFLAGTNRAPAREVNQGRFDFYLARIEGEIKPFTGRETRIVLGNTILLGVQEEGFHGIETYGPNTYRWTSGSANIKIEARFKDPLKYGMLKVAAARPEGSRAQLELNGTQVLDVNVPSNGGDFQFTVPDSVFDSDSLDLVLKAETFIPHQRNPESRDHRELGLKLSGIKLSSENQPTFGNVSFGPTPIEGFRESGLYETEEDKGGLRRWTNGSASFAFRRKRDFTPQKLHLSFTKSILPETAFEILWNGESIFQGTVIRNKSMEFDIPLDRILDTQDVILSINSEAKTPQELGINEDERRLGLRIAKIEITGDYTR